MPACKFCNKFTTTKRSIVSNGIAEFYCYDCYNAIKDPFYIHKDLDKKLRKGKLNRFTRLYINHANRLFHLKLLSMRHMGMSLKDPSGLRTLNRRIEHNLILTY